MLWGRGDRTDLIGQLIEVHEAFNDSGNIFILGETDFHRSEKERGVRVGERGQAITSVESNQLAIGGQVRGD